MLRKQRSTLFANPGYTATATWLLTTIGYLVPSFVKLLPLGELDNNAESRRNDAQNVFNNVFNELKNVQEKINEAKQRIENLDCAIAGYPAFNQRAENFQKNINASTLPPLDTLNKIWNMSFVTDKTITDQSKQTLSWTTSETTYGYVYGCYGQFYCGKDTSCCYKWDSYQVDVTHYYDETTTIINNFKNILQGGALRLEPLSCGYYSRHFKISSPTKVMTYESPRHYHGHREDGATYIDFSRDWGSNVKGSCLFDEQVINLDANVLRPVTQYEAATDLTEKLFHFLAACVTAIEAVGANYPALQEKIRQSIPGLIDKAAAINATLQEKAQSLAGAEAEYKVAHNDFKEGQAIWLPQLFLVPAAIALLVYVSILYWRNRPEKEHHATVTANNTDPEKGLKVANYSPPQYDPKYFNHNIVPSAPIEENILEQQPPTYRK